MLHAVLHIRTRSTRICTRTYKCPNIGVCSCTCTYLYVYIVYSYIVYLLYYIVYRYIVCYLYNAWNTIYHCVRMHTCTYVCTCVGMRMCVPSCIARHTVRLQMQTCLRQPMHVISWANANIHETHFKLWSGLYYEVMRSLSIFSSVHVVRFAKI